MNKALIFKLILILLLLTGITIFGSKTWKDYQVEQDKNRLEAMYSQILEGASTAPPLIQITYNNQISTGSPLVFGGVHSPEPQHENAWEVLEDIGVTSIRTDFGINKALPKSSIDAYKANINNIQDISTWNKYYMENTKSKFILAKEKGMTTIGIIDYTPSWLSINGKEFAPPMDFDVYKDLVKKNYRYYRDFVDYIEIWNEPDFDYFLNVNGTGMTKEEAYKLIFLYSVSGINEVDTEINDGKKVKIGGPVIHRPDATSLLKALLEEKEIRQKVDFISYHSYDTQKINDKSYQIIRSELKKYGMDKSPLFLTEWNYSSKGEESKIYSTTDLGILYTADKFIEYLRNNFSGANYFSMSQINKPNTTELNGFGFYSYNDKIKLMPASKSWRLMSKNMKLGKGESHIYDFKSNDSDINGLGFKNVDGQYGVVLTNKSTESKLTRLKLNNLGLSKYVKVDIYYATADNDASAPIYSGEIKQDNNSLNLLVYLPKEAVIGVLLSEDKTWFDFVNLPY